MAYAFNKVTIRTNNTAEGMAKIQELWQDVASGKIPLLYDSTHQLRQGISPISSYSHYESDEHGDYDLSILAVQADFFQIMEKAVCQGQYKKYDESDESGNIGTCTQKAWQKVWDDQKNGQIHRSYTIDYESTVPAKYTKDGKAHCYLYIAQKVL